MNRRAADTIGRSLARLGHLRSADREEAASSREHLYRLLQEAGRPLSLEELSQLTTLHVNTIRTHLEVLQAAGRVERTRQPSNGRGRPRSLYAPVSDDPYHRLAQDLSEALEAADAETAEAAAARWRQADDVSQVQVKTPDEAVGVAAQALEQLGFDVETSPVGDAVFLGNCPYASLIADHPVICDIHASALEQVLASTGQDVRLASLDVFPRSGVCVAHLRRPDIEPMRVVRGKGRS